MPSKFIVIKKTIYGVFEATESNVLAKHMIELDEADELNGGAFGAWSACKKACSIYDKDVAKWEESEELKGLSFLHNLEEILFDDVCDMVETKESDIFLDEELFGDLFQPNKLKTNFSFDYLVTIKPSSSSEEQIDESICKDKYKKSLYYERNKKLKEVNEYLRTKIIVGDGRKEDFYLEMMFSQLETIEKILTNS